MAEKEYLLGNKCKELLIYTTQTTKPIADDRIDSRDIVNALKGVLNSPNMKDALNYEITLLNQRKKKRRGFPKSVTFTFVKDLRKCALSILKNAHAANECMFQTEFEQRIRLIKNVIDDCNLMLSLVEICLDLHFIDIKQSEYWTKLITNVKYMSIAWKKKESERAKEILKSRETENVNHEKRMITAIFNSLKQN